MWQHGQKKTQLTKLHLWEFTVCSRKRDIEYICHKDIVNLSTYIWLVPCIWLHCFTLGGKKPTRAVRLEAIWLFFTTDILTSVVVNHQGNMKSQSTNSNTVWEVGRYLITSQNTTLHQFQVSKGGWGVREGRGSVGNANQRLTKNIQNTKRIKLY